MNLIIGLNNGVTILLEIPWTGLNGDASRARRFTEEGHCDRDDRLYLANIERSGIACNTSK